MSKNTKPNWTLRVILDEETNYFEARTFVDNLANEIKKKMKKENIIGIVIATVEQGIKVSDADK